MGLSKLARGSGPGTGRPPQRCPTRSQRQSLCHKQEFKPAQTHWPCHPSLLCAWRSHWPFGLLSFLLCAWRSHLLGRWREIHEDSLAEKEWLEIVWHTAVHHRVIPQALDIRKKTLRACPLHLNDFLTGKASPEFSAEAIELLHGAIGITRGNHIHKCVTSICTSFEIHWQVHKVEVAASQYLEQLRTRAIVCNVPHHDGGGLGSFLLGLAVLSIRLVNCFLGLLMRPDLLALYVLLGLDLLGIRLVSCFLGLPMWPDLLALCVPELPRVGKECWIEDNHRGHQSLSTCCMHAKLKALHIV